MMNYKELKRKEFLFEIIDDVIGGMDVYNYNGSLWLIKTEELKWAVEFTNDKTLWYNYNLFKNLFKAISLDVSKNQKYITEWFESRFLKPEVVEDTIQNGVKHTKESPFANSCMVGDTIQNGVKHTLHALFQRRSPVEDTIQNGVKHTQSEEGLYLWRVEDTIQNGVKHTQGDQQPFHIDVEDTIQKGVKQTKGTLRHPEFVEDEVQNGVIHTQEIDWNRDIGLVEDTIQNGVKHTLANQFGESIRVEDTIQNGVKHTIPALRSCASYVEDTIQNGVKDTVPLRRLNTFSVEDTIQNGVKETIDLEIDDEKVVEDTIQNGVKETISTLRRTLLGVDDIIQNGVKEIRSNKGLITSYRQNHKAKETIENGVMNTKPMDEWVNSENIIKYTVEYGVKETHKDVYHHRPRICGVIKNGVKEVQPLPAQDGNRDWGNYYFGKQDRTKPFNDYLNDAIKYGKKI